MANRVIPQTIQRPILDSVKGILTGYSKAWKGHDSTEYEFIEKDGVLIAKQGDAEFEIMMVVVNNG